MAANFDGMEFMDSSLGAASRLEDVAAAEAWASSHGIPADPSPTRLHRLQRLAAAEKANPDIVNRQLPLADAGLYWQQFYRYACLLAHSLDDIREPAKVEKMRIRTFGTPVHRPPTRLPPAQAAFVRKEVAEARAASLIAPGASPWSSTSFAVPKPHSTKLRLVLDFCWLNA